MTAVYTTTMQRSPLTKRQKLVLDHIKEYIAKYKESPTLEEINNFLGTAYTSGFHYLRVLEKKGYIKRKFNAPRSIVVLDSEPHPVRLAAFILGLELALVHSPSQLLEAWRRFVIMEELPLNQKAFVKWIKSEKLDQHLVRKSSKGGDK